MEYRFSEEKFIESFKAKTDDIKSVDSIRLTHNSDLQFKLFPYKASGKTPIVYELEDIVSAFFRETASKKTEPIVFEELCDDLLEEVDVDENDIDYFKDMVQSFFFRGNEFIADNLGLYPYQTATNNKSADNLAHFIFSVMDIDESDCQRIEKAKEQYQFNVLENMVIKTIENKKVSEAEVKPVYFKVKTDIQELFKKDFSFMLESGMASLEDFSNLFAIYYFYYVSQTSIILDQFCQGRRDSNVKLYYALDWEKVSKNRMCCIEGWEKLQENLNHMFSHAITLEIINQTQTQTDRMIDYIALGELAKNSSLDLIIAEEIEKAEAVYCSYIGDYKGFDSIPYSQGGTKTGIAVNHLFRCVFQQFMNTGRKRANQFYNEKFIEFCKSRWVKNRKKSGLVLNLTERDIIFMTKICIRDKEKIRLNDLYKEYEKRGIYLDGTSKGYLQEFFTKLNLIDKKSDSGDAQYVKRIL